MNVVDKLDPDGTQYRCPEAIRVDKATNRRVLKYQFPKGTVDLTAHAAFAGYLVQATEIAMSARKDELSFIAHESRGHPGVLFHSLVVEHHSDPAHWHPYGIFHEPQDL